MKSPLKASSKLNLQFFADDGAGREISNDNAGNDQSDDKDNSQVDSNQKPDGDDKKSSLSELRKMFSSQMHDFRKNEFLGLLEDACKDGENRAKMTEKKFIATDTKKREDKPNKREAVLNQSGALSNTKSKLTQIELPTIFSEMLNNLDETKQTQNINEFKKAYSE